MRDSVDSRLRFSIHGQSIELNVSCASLVEPLGTMLGEFSVGALPAKPSPVCGSARPFDSAQVMRCLSQNATRVSSENDLVELYQEDERFWRIDDHWGLCEINILRGQFRSWLLPQPMLDPLRVAEQAVLWPVAQLLRTRGLCVIPAAGVVRDGWGALVLCSFNIEPELSALVHAGYRIVGQNWVALRERHGRLMMLKMPGQLERIPARMPGISAMNHPTRVDLTREMLGSACDESTCDAVLLIAPGRRPLPHLRPIASAGAVGALRSAWPMAELHPQRRQGQFVARLAQRASVCEVQLSRNSADMLALMETARQTRRAIPTAAPVREVA